VPASVSGARREDAEGDREVEATSFLGQIGWCEVDGDALLRVLVARLQERGAHAILALAHGRLGQADDRRLRDAAAQVHFDLDRRRLDAALRATVHGRKAHACDDERGRAGRERGFRWSARDQRA